MKTIALTVTSIFLLGTTIGAARADTLASAQGVVIATQGTEDQPKFEEPGSIATPVEIWIARIDHWSKEQKKSSGAKMILIQYEFSEQYIGLKDLNRTVWKFELQALSAQERKSCLAWTRTDQHFAPTLFAASSKLPRPEDLPCFRMKKRPLPVQRIKASSTDEPSTGASFLADSTVVAIQKAKDEVRMLDNTDADLVEVWMVRVEHWPGPQKPGIVLVEYTHHDSIIKDSELDKTTWRFEIRQAPPEKSGTCLSWWAAERSFVPTAFGRHGKLPDAKTLSCFLMTKRPVPVQPVPTTH